MNVASMHHALIQHVPVPAPENATYLTCDALLSYCETRLRGLDEQVQKSFAGQKRANQDSVTLQNLLNSVSNCLTGGIPADSASAHHLIRAYQWAINAAGPDTPLGQKLVAARDAFIARVSNDGGAGLHAKMNEPDFWSKPLAADADKGLVSGCSGEDIKGFVEQIKGFQTEINQGAELGMITLQSLMSQRQMAVQLVTNMVQSLGEMMNKVAANIGR